LKDYERGLDTSNDKKAFEDDLKPSIGLVKILMARSRNWPEAAISRMAVSSKSTVSVKRSTA
jgi:hypothetical protein